MTDASTAPGRALIESGFAIAGSMTGPAATVVYSPADAAMQLDDRFSACLRELADDLAEGALPRRERGRAGAALAFAVEHGVTLSHRDRRVRTDGFFTERAGGRVAAREVGEAVLLAARASADERRVRHLGCLLAEVVTSPDVDAALADRTLRTVERLSWRQLALLAAVGRRERHPLPLTPLPTDPRAWTTWGALEDLVELQQAGLLDPPVAVPRPGGSAVPRLRPADLRLTRRGVLVHRLLALDFVRADDVTAALTALA
ncbi:hypothetical protein [Modestobacter sp. Leaf380]|uniref:hypothetical protein n=1 Tax=Modestobacter sp. Leaf380 TaxID=1736356 RepID=UPI0006FE135C|nr:hypothetical protein [Modestobacter sp. Leaf380]KQS69370.1 hypothetical protein ASG41_21530 [Modestobacter sp. Leaf380]